MSLLSKGNWILPNKVGVESVVQYLLNSRGIEDEDMFLRSTLEDVYPYTELFNSEIAAKKIKEFVESKKKIVIHGDFDADGICSVSILWEYLFKELEYDNVMPYIPSRVDQGYGLTESSLKDMLDMGADLVISVDCGVRDKELIKRYRDEFGLEFVITDHHQPPEDILDSLDYILVHPMYPGNEYPFPTVCGAFVSFMLTQALRDEKSINEDTKGLDLVALATVTDIMPLVDVNRVVVKYGLEQMRKGSRLGLVELCNISSIDLKDIESYHLGFVLGPRINASGRIGSPLDAVKLLVSNNADVCKKISNILNETNFQRQYMTQMCLEEAEKAIGSSEDNLFFVVGEDWHEGIVGLVAGKLNEKYNRPVLVATRSEDGVRGSARSIKGFDITKALENCSEYLDRYGGHEQAAGFTVKPDMLKKFSSCIKDIANKKITKEMLVKNTYVDLLVSTQDIDYPLLDKLERLKPYGYGNPKPVIALTNLVVFKKQIMGKLGNHMKLVCKGDGVDLITLIFFGCDEDTETIHLDDRIDVIGNISINSYNGNEDIQFQVKEWRYSKV